jgi:tetratricopeptide (TPR) repeat protein
VGEPKLRRLRRLCHKAVGFKSQEKYRITHVSTVLLMLIKFLYIIACSFSIASSAYSQPALQDTLWNKLSYINDTLKSPSESELQFLLKIDSSKNKLPNRPDSVYTFLLSGLGYVYYRQGDYMKAIRYYKHSIDLIHSNIDKSWSKPDLLIMCYFRLSVIYDSLNRVSDKMKALDSCISIAGRRNVINLYYLGALYRKIMYYFDVGDYSNCINYAAICEIAAKRYIRSSGAREYDHGMQYVNSSLIWNAMSQMSLKNYFIADSLLNEKLEEFKRTGNTFDLGSLYEQLATVQLLKGDRGKALGYYQKALTVEKKAAHDISCKGVLNNIGYYIYFRNDKNYDRALYYYKKALTIENRDYSQVELNSVEALNILCNIANVYVQKELYDSAFIYYQLAMNQIKPGIKEVDLLHSQYDQFARQKKTEYITSLLLDKGDAFLKFYKATGKPDAVKEAVRIYKIADQLLDRIRTEQTDPQSKLFWRADSKRLYEHGIEACYSYNNSEDAFYFFEKSRAVLLNDQLNEQRWLGDEDILKQTETKKKILELVRASDGLDKDSNRYKEIQEELFTARRELEHLIQLIKERDPLYYQSYIDLNVATVRDVNKNILTDHQGLVEIFSGDSAVFVLTLKSGHADFTKLSKNEFDSLSTNYMSYLSNEGSLNRGMNKFLEISRNLYRLIFNKGKLPGGRILISPDGQYFPFEALVTSDAGQPVKYFLDDYATSYTYSAKYLMNPFFDRNDSGAQVFFGVAPVTYPPYMQIAGLKGSDLSLARVRKNFRNASDLVYSEATRSGFMNQFSKYRIIQLYTHAVASGGNKEPIIYFADSTLSLSELLGENKPATRLIVLSACETGKGKLLPGEGVFSFNRGFAALGIPASVSNLWSVDDQSTYELTELFYKYLARNLPVDLALQKAKLEFVQTASKQNQLPYFWAAPILIGKSNSLHLDQAMSWIQLVLISLILALVIAFIYNVILNR